MISITNTTILITNNKALCQAVRQGRYIDGSSLDALVAVRDVVHKGGVLLTHPLCGNLRPYQQPFRSVLIEEHPGASVDLSSLDMIENAITVYRDCRDSKKLLLPTELDEGRLLDYAYIDSEIMRESLERYKQIDAEHPLKLHWATFNAKRA